MQITKKVAFPLKAAHQGTKMGKSNAVKFYRQAPPLAIIPVSIKEHENPVIDLVSSTVFWP